MIVSYGGLVHTHHFLVSFILIYSDLIQQILLLRVKNALAVLAA